MKAQNCEPLGEGDRRILERVFDVSAEALLNVSLPIGMFTQFKPVGVGVGQCLIHTGSPIFRER